MNEKATKKTGTTKKTGKGLRMRAAAVGAVCAAMLAGGAGAATAAPLTAPTTHPATVAAATPVMHASITAHANHTSVKSGSSVIISGKVKDIKTGSKLTVSHLNSSGKWTALHASGTVKKHGVYAVHVKLSHKGAQQLRVVHGKTMSPIVHVNVT
ncbi:hypothetical protein ACIOMQ_06220 [Streptomyces sp. NPDC087845]|uniref:hypothetical protein n=1 Tax=Streptomyces sp. NPDC087845 TaxID=3365806 RepID=UPI00382FFFF2